jgi:hypothetical protein
MSYGDPDRGRRFQEACRPTMTPEEREENLPVGSAEQIRRVFERYRSIGVDGLIFSGIPMNPRIYHRLDDDVLALFD